MKQKRFSPLPPNKNSQDEEEVKDSDYDQYYQIIFIGSSQSGKKQLYTALCGQKEQLNYTVYPKRGIIGNIYFHQTPDVDLGLASAYQEQVVIESAIKGAFSKINRIIFLLNTECCYNEYYTKSIRIKENQQFEQFLEHKLYHQDISVILTYISYNEEVINNTFNGNIYQFGNLQLPIILVNLDKLQDLEYVKEILTKLERQHLTNNNIINISQLKYNTDQKIIEQISNRIKIKFEEFFSNKQKINNIRELHNFLMEFNQNLFQKAISIYKNLINQYQIIQECKVKLYPLIKDKIQQLINLILEQVDKVSIQQIRQCPRCLTLVLTDSYMYIECNSNQIFVCESQVYDKQKQQCLYCNYSDSYRIVDQDYIKKQKNKYIQYIKDQCNYYQEILSNDRQNQPKPIQNQIIELVQPQIIQDQLSKEDQPNTNQPQQILLIGSSYSSKQLVFSKMCKFLQWDLEYLEQTIFPIQTNIENVYFHLTPDIQLRSTKDVVELIEATEYGSSNQLSAIVLFIDTNGDPSAFEHLVELELYNHKIIIVFDRQIKNKFLFSQDNSSIVFHLMNQNNLNQNDSILAKQEYLQFIDINRHQFNEQQFQNQLMNCLKRIPSRSSQGRYEPEIQDYLFTKIDSTVNQFNNYFDRKSFEQLTFAQLEKVLYYIFFKFISDFTKQIQNSYIVRQYFRYKYHKNIILWSTLIFDQMKSQIEQITQSNSRRCQNCSNLVFNAKDSQSIMCSYNRVLMEQEPIINIKFQTSEFVQDYQIKQNQIYYQCTYLQSWNKFERISEEYLDSQKSKFIDRIKLLFPFRMQQQIQQKILQQVQIEPNQDCQYNILLIGQSGVGKTTFLKKVCNNFQQIQFIVKKKQKVSLLKGVIGNIAIYDTPSFDIRNEEGGSNYKVIDDFACIFQKIKSVNQIFILANYQRIGLMKRMIEECCQPLRKFKSCITVVITNLDEELTNNQTEEISQRILKYFGITSEPILNSNGNDKQILQNLIKEKVTKCEIQELNLKDTLFESEGLSEEGQAFVQGLNSINKQMLQQKIEEEKYNIQQKFIRLDEYKQYIYQLEQKIKEYKKLIQQCEQDSKDLKNRKNELNNSQSNCNCW